MLKDKCNKKNEIYKANNSVLRRKLENKTC